MRELDGGSIAAEGLDYEAPAPTGAKQREVDLELIWSLHASIFYLGVRKWVYGLPVPDDFYGVIDRQINVFLNGMPATLKTLNADAPKTVRRKSA